MAAPPGGDPRGRPGTVGAREGTPTTTQVLERIKSAEAEVEEVLKKARENREATVQKARQDAMRHIRNTEEAAREEHQKRIQQATAKARQAADRYERDADQEVTKIEATFDERLEDSKKRILNMFERALDAQD